MARHSARALVDLAARSLASPDVFTDAAVRNAMVVHVCSSRPLARVPRAVMEQ
jgi:dihydroxyacid dehydratase/phosphogluconate dehydratase